MIDIASVICSANRGLRRAFALLVLGPSLALAPLCIAQDADREVADNCQVFVAPGSANFDISEVPQPAEGVEFPADAVIGEIVFTRYPIFNEDDPEENNILFRTANFLHINTRPQVLASQLLFEEGDPVNRRQLEESARLLRDSDYLYDARVWPYRVCGNRVDVEVVTREVWTLSGGISFSRSGGNDESELSIADSNFLGYGKTFSLTSTSSSDRDGIEFMYDDPNVLGSRHTLKLFYADNDDGYHNVIEAELPFYALDARYAWGLHYSEHERIDDVYERGEEVAAYGYDQRQSEFFFGISDGWRDGISRRWWFGVHTDKQDYYTVASEPAPVELPPARRVNYPFLRYDFIEENFIQVSNLNQMHRIEDFNLGSSWSWRLGVADSIFDSDADRLVYGLDIRKAWQINEQTLSQLKTSLAGYWRYDDNQSESVTWEANWRWYNGVGKRHGTYLALDMRLGRNLTIAEELMLGAEEQLRGYPDRYQKGNRSVVFTAEQRYYTDIHLWRLLRIGGAVFFDVGRAWTPGDELSGATGVLADVGFGLRLASSRAQTRRIIHIDVAFPLQRQSDVDSVQVLVTTKQSF